MASGFKLRQNNHELKIEELTISSLTLTAGDLLEIVAGATAATEGDSSTIAYDRKGVVIEDATTSDTKIKAIMVDSDQLWEVESNAESSTSDNGDAMVLRKLAQLY